MHYYRRYYLCYYQRYYLRYYRRYGQQCAVRQCTNGSVLCCALCVLRWLHYYLHCAAMRCAALSCDPTYAALHCCPATCVVL